MLGASRPAAAINLPNGCMTITAREAMKTDIGTGAANAANGEHTLTERVTSTIGTIESTATAETINSGAESCSGARAFAGSVGS